MPRTPRIQIGHRIHADTKFNVLSSVMEYLPLRTQARFRAVSKAIGAMVSAEATKPPVYAALLDELHARVLSAPVGMVLEITAGGLEDGDWGAHVSVTNTKRGRMVRVQAGGMQMPRWRCITRCKAYNLKFVIYRMIERNKTIDNHSVRSVLIELASRYCGIIHDLSV